MKDKMVVMLGGRLLSEVDFQDLSYETTQILKKLGITSEQHDFLNAIEKEVLRRERESSLKRNPDEEIESILARGLERMRHQQELIENMQFRLDMFDDIMFIAGRRSNAFGAEHPSPMHLMQKKLEEIRNNKAKENVKCQNQTERQ